MDTAIIKALSELLDEKLTPIKEDINGMKQDINGMKTDIKFIKVQQEEHGKILRILEDKAITNKAEHDKLSNDIAHLSEKVESVRKDLATVEVVIAKITEDLKIIK